MSRIYPISLLCFLFLPVSLICPAQSTKDVEPARVTLPNGWMLSPAGQQLPLGDLPLNMVFSRSGKYLAVTNNGQSDQYIQLFDANELRLLDSVTMAISWVGLAFSDDERLLYASGGNNNWIVKFKITYDRLKAVDTFRLGNPWPEKISIAGIALDENHRTLYAVTKENNSLYVIDLKEHRVAGQFPLGGEGYTCLLSGDRDELYISCWGCNKVIIFDTKKQQISGSVAVGDNPNELCLTRNGDFLFVANANDNSVSVINTKERRVVETLNAALYPDSPAGSTTNGLALDESEKNLYIANADNNCLAVFDVSKPGSSFSKGFIPTGWYPSCVRTSGKRIFVANGKGLSSRANPQGPNPTDTKETVTYQKAGNTYTTKVQYIGGLFRGTMSVINVPDDKQLSVYSQEVYRNTPYSTKRDRPEGASGYPIPYRPGDASPIKHVFYIIKENRTYDQVLGDMKEGNGDTSLVLFGEKVTPNQHAIAREFVLLDNFFVNGEVSADGHNWSLGGYATDYLEKNWPTNYSDRGGTYDSEGTREIANNKDGFIWDFCKRYGVTYRTYGEFADNYKPNIPVLIDHFCPFYTSWDQHVRDTVRFYQWKRDFDSLFAAGKVPQLNTLRFINDHTEGLDIGRPTPFAHAADNDLAVGLFVDYLSHSKIWNESVVFIVEDDAQNGPDHVDAHRSTAYVAGGFVKEGFVDHTPYTTTSILKTIELILGLPPMSQYDAAASCMWRCFNKKPVHKPYNVRFLTVDLNDKNTQVSQYSMLSEKFDFSKEDRAPDGLFNMVIWKAVKGLDSPCPAPVRAAFLNQKEQEEEEER